MGILVFRWVSPLVTVCWEEAKDLSTCIYDKLDECGGEPEWEHIHM